MSRTIFFSFNTFHLLPAVAHRAESRWTKLFVGLEPLQAALNLVSRRGRIAGLTPRT